MKKIILALGFISFLSIGSATAQEESPASKKLSDIENLEEVKDKTVWESEDGLFSFDMLNHLDFGWHNVEGDSFIDKFGKSTEIALNVFEMGINPSKWFSIYAGADLRWNRFTGKKSVMFGVNSGNIIATPASGMHSTIRNFAISVPIGLHFHAGDFGIRIGAEANFNIDKFTRIVSDYSTADIDYTARQKGGKLESMTYDCFAYLYYSIIGVYYKYCPKSLTPDSDIIKSYSTIGIALMF